LLAKAERNFNTSFQVLNIPPSGELRFFRGFYFVSTRWHHGWMKGFLAFSVLLFFLFSNSAFADFAAGKKAYDKRDYATALKEWRPLAEQGGAHAQLNLGVMYFNGQGVTRDYIRAHMWWNIVVSLGINEAAVNLSMVQRKMTPTEIRKAKQLASDCVAKNYKGC